MNLIIYTRFPAVVADLLETHYKHIVTPDAAEMIGPIEQGSIHVEFPYTYTGKRADDPLEAWMRWAMNCGLMRSYKLEKV